MQKLSDLQQQIEKLQKEAASIRSKDFHSTVVEIQKTMAAFGITIKDLQVPRGKIGHGRKSKEKNLGKSRKITTKSVGSGVAPKYCGPNGELWSGRGLTPKWMQNLVASGLSKDTFLIQPVIPVVAPVDLNGSVL